jgi:beta-fructofuranosidase
MRTISSAAALLAALPGGSALDPSRLFARQNQQSCESITADQVRAAPWLSLFNRWRPQSHFLAPSGWMNDPCGAFYDSTRDEYQLYYQWHPNHIQWGNISWGGAKSKDLITWEDLGGWQDNDAYALGPTGNGSYDGLGIFSGSIHPINLQGEVDGTYLAFYTGAAILPTKWRDPYFPGTENQAFALSTDGGLNYVRYEENPVINATTRSEPMNWDLTGFRDPFLIPGDDIDAALGNTEPHWYAVFGSGIKGVGPRMPLWQAPKNDLTKWTFLGALWEPAKGTSIGPGETTGTWAQNFELSGFFSLRDRAGNVHWYTNQGTEGGELTWRYSDQTQIWNEGTVSRRQNGSLAFEPISGGLGDWGLGYAANSFNDTKRNKRVQFAWIKEDIVAENALWSARQQGWQGAFSLPRELFVHEVDNVEADAEIARAKTTIVEQGTARTLGTRPLADVVEGLRSGATPKTYGNDGGWQYTKSTSLEQSTTGAVEISATVLDTTGPVGLTIAASADGEEYTNIIWNPSNYEVRMVRNSSTNFRDGEVRLDDIIGYFYPYTVNGRREEITFNVFVDGSVVELYINERFAMSGRVYPTKTCSTGFGVYVGEGVQATFGETRAWIGTLNAWPQRPTNSSSQLFIDSAEDTNNYSWWVGN